MKKLWLKRILFIITGLFTIILVYGLWGPLYPWNPVKLSYEKIEFENATFFIRDIEKWDKSYNKVDGIMRKEEEFHGMKYKHRIKIFCVPDSADFKRFLPWLKSSKASSFILIFLPSYYLNYYPCMDYSQIY